MSVLDLKIGVIIPDRGDRPQFLAHCLKMMERQSLAPVRVLIVTATSPQPLSKTCAQMPSGEGLNSRLPVSFLEVPGVQGKFDITKRYRLGYEAMSAEVDLIAFIENDDWYAPDYLERMGEEWLAQGRPDIFGTGYTIYYHLKQRAWFHWPHTPRASAMNTLLRPGMDMNWPMDEDPYTDLWLWFNAGLLKQGPLSPCANTVLQTTDGDEKHPDWAPNHLPVRRITWSPIDKLGRHLAIGLKHGTGLCGGPNHSNKLNRFKEQDPDMEWLRRVVGNEDLLFYKNLFS